MRTIKLYLFLFSLLLSSSLVAQNVGVGTTTPNAVLEIKAANPASPANSDGIIIPRIDAFPAVNPTILQHGMMVYLTTAAGANQPGFYYWNNNSTSWVSLTGAASGTMWNLTGNTGTTAGTHFIGTRDDVDLIFKRDNLYSGRIGSTNTSLGKGSLRSALDYTGNTGIGANSLANNINGTYNAATGHEALYSNVNGHMNTAMGYRTLYGNTNGGGNVAIGATALSGNTGGAENVAIGASAMQSNNGGNNNTALGTTALMLNEGGNNNTAVGNQALFNSRNVSENSAVGYRSLFSNATGISNTAMGSRSLTNTTTGSDNTAMGIEALLSNVTGGQNTAMGVRSLRAANATGNTAIGYESMLSNNSGGWSTAVGHGALASNTNGDFNVALGASALAANTTGVANTAIGTRALASNIGASLNVAVGTDALNANTSGRFNTATGGYSLKANTTGDYNTATGVNTLVVNTTGGYNVAIGAEALKANTTGIRNTAVGSLTLVNNTIGNYNTAIGIALYANTTGSNNNAIGNAALSANTIGSGNNAFGDRTLVNNPDGSNNTAIGSNALVGLTAGSNNTAIGYNAQVPIPAASNQLSIANVIYAMGTGNSGAGNVGIGNDNPTSKLDVAGKTKTVNFQMTAGAVNNYILRTDGVGNASWVGLNALETDPKVGGMSGNQVAKWNGSQLVNSSITDNGWVGIGTTSPGAQLHIVGGSPVGVSNQQRAYFHVNTSNIVQDVSSSGGVVVRADGWVWANGGGFLATSDARIKNITGITNNEADLATLQQIQVTDYTYKDEISQGSGRQKKVVAQQVKEIYPVAVSQSTGIIPSVLELAKSVKIIDKSTAISTSKPHGFITGDEVKLILDKSGEKTYTITVTAPDSFTVPTTINESVFVYGKKVKDLLNVDYDALTTLNISATQQLIKEIETLKAENLKLKTDMQEQMANLLKRLEQLEKK
jgi:hypothetical protein